MWYKVPMILVTGGSGFIGSNLVRRLTDEGKEVKVLIRPSEKSPSLPKGVPVEVAISSLKDERGLRAALVGVHEIFHLAGVNWLDQHLNWFATEVEGTRAILQAAKDADVKKIITLSHLGADRASAYPLQKSKAIAEEEIRKSGLNYTIIRSGLVYGSGDNFTVPLAQLMAMSPGFFPISGDGQSLLQPIWVKDLVSCLAWSLANEECSNAVIEIGGPEHLTINEILSEIKLRIGSKSNFVNVRPSYYRYLSGISRFFFPRLPITNVWVDYLASNRVASLDSITKIFGLLPSRFSHRLEHLEAKDKSVSLSRALPKREKN